MTEKTQLLFEWGDPRKREKSQSYREWDDYLHNGFSEEDVPDLIKLLHDINLRTDYADTNKVWVPLYAWRILGQLKSAQATGALIDATDIFDEDDDWAISEIPVALGMIGEPALPMLADRLLDDAASERSRVAASDALKEAVRHYPELRTPVIDYFQEYLFAPDLNCPGFNGLLVANLLGLKAIELIKSIRDLYAKDCVDLSVCGDIEDVEIDLGLRTERETPPPVFGLSDLAGISEIEELRDLLARQNLDLQEENAKLRYAAQAGVPETYTRETPKVGRNDPCPCGSGKKYKRCCL